MTTTTLTTYYMLNYNYYEILGIVIYLVFLTLWKCQCILSKYIDNCRKTISFHHLNPQQAETSVKQISIEAKTFIRSVIMYGYKRCTLRQKYKDYQKLLKFGFWVDMRKFIKPLERWRVKSFGHLLRQNEFVSTLLK